MRARRALRATWESSSGRFLNFSNGIVAAMDKQWFQNNREARVVNGMNDQPLLVSVVIPMRNEEKYIVRCLDTVIANDFPAQQFEILVVDGESTDCSRKIVFEKQAKFPNLRLLRNPQRVVPPGMNIGIRQAKGRFIVRMDAHSEYPPDYITNCVAELERTGAANVGGRWITKPGSDSLIAKTIAF